MTHDDDTLSGAVNAIGAILDGIDRETSLMALGAVTLQLLVNQSDNQRHAQDLALLFGTNMISGISDAFQRGFGKS